MVSSSDWAKNWPLLSEARDRLDTIIATRAVAAAVIDGPIITLRDDALEPVETTRTVAAFLDIIGRGAVPVIGVRDDCGSPTAERVEALLAVARHTNSLTAINQIDAYFDSRRDRSIFGARSDLIDPALYPPSELGELGIRFSEVRVHWPTLVTELGALGIPTDDALDDVPAPSEPPDRPPAEAHLSHTTYVSQEAAERSARWQREAWRKRWIAKFSRRQRRSRRWVCLYEIAKWCASVAPIASVDEQTRALELACDRLVNSARTGEFDREREIMVLWLVPDVFTERHSDGLRFTPWRLRLPPSWFEHNDSLELQLRELPNCWVPIDLAHKWLTARAFPWPPHFEAESEGELGTGTCRGDVVQEDRRAEREQETDGLDDVPAPSEPPDRPPAEARMPESRPIPQWPTGEFKKRRLERRADIEAAIDWCLVDRAIELVARRRNISFEGAWDAIRLNISLGQLPAQCIDDRGERIAFAPHWIELLAKFQLATEPGTLDQPIGTVEDFLRFSDFPRGGILWFDRRRAVENRLARKITEDNRAEPSLPPIRVRDVVVNQRRLDELYPEEDGLGRDRKLAEALGADRGDPRGSPAPNGALAVDRRRGPKPGTVNRYGASDRALFPEVERIMQEDRVTAFAAALKLAEGSIGGKRVEGFGTPKSRAKRLAGSYLKKREPETR
jgi:hypothetical protein